MTIAGIIAASAATGTARGDAPPPGPDTHEAWIQCPRCHPSHWTTEEARPFISLRMDVGYLYVKPRFSFGYGKPFSLWAGVDVTPLATPDYAGGYSGLRLQLPWFDFRIGARAVHAFLHQFLKQQDSYNLVDLAEITGHATNYVDFEAELTGAVPLGPGSILLLATASSIQSVPTGYDVYDENLRVIVRPPPVYRGRAGYALRFLPENNAQLGLVAELIEIPDRKAQVVRAGLVATFDIDDHFQAIATLVAPILSPDSIGLAGADYTELGIRYRWTTGHSHSPQERIPDEIAASDGGR
ncbi:MAG: hypothetical protein WBY94_16145 [Polyangiaceae bacterium]